MQQRRSERLAEVHRRHLITDRAQKEAKDRRDAMTAEVAVKAAAKGRKREEAAAAQQVSTLCFFS